MTYQSRWEKLSFAAGNGYEKLLKEISLSGLSVIILSNALIWAANVGQLFS